MRFTIATIFACTQYPSQNLPSRSPNPQINIPPQSRPSPSLNCSPTTPAPPTSVQATAPNSSPEAASPTQTAAPGAAPTSTASAFVPARQQLSRPGRTDAGSRIRMRMLRLRRRRRRLRSRGLGGWLGRRGGGLRGRGVFASEGGCGDIECKI
jgi:hypothetical protein